MDVPGRDAMMQASKNHPFLILSDGTDAYAEVVRDTAFRVFMDTADTYQLQTATAKTIFVSPLKGHVHHRKPANLLDTLNHIAEYKFLEGIENLCPNREFEASFLLSPTASPDEDGFYRVKHKEDFTLSFKNQTDHPLYLTIFIFTDRWEVRNLASEQGEEASIIVPPKERMDDGEEKLLVTMFVPTEVHAEGSWQTEDIIKVFVTKKSSAFPGYLLHKLGQHVPLRQTHGPMGPMDKLLKALGWDLRDKDKSRSDWATRNYLIRTCLES
jgi:hypothetical protein